MNLVNMLDELDILIPTRNRIDELVKTIDIHLGFGVRQDQFHVIDDASTYDINILKSKYPGINFIRNEASIGQLRSRNILFKSTKRPFALSLDDDSHVIAKEHIEQAIDILKSSASRGIFSFRTFEQIESPGIPYLPDARVRCIRTFIACGALIKREVIDAIEIYTRGELGYFGEEYDCSIRAFKKGFYTVTQDNLIVHHRVNRKHNSMPLRSDFSKGVYGRRFRSMMGFSDNLMIVQIYYPFGIASFFIGLYTIKRFWNYLVLKGDVYGFFKGILRFFRMLPYCIRHTQKLPYLAFINWMRLPTY